jgi:acyl-coenzyme A thioesterase PaaI-like protein
MPVDTFIAQQAVGGTSSAVTDIAVAAVAIALLAVGIAAAVGILLVKRHRTTTDRLETLEGRVEELERTRSR